MYARLILLATSSLIILQSIAQCDAPETYNWQFITASQLEIEIESSSNMESYELQFVGLYDGAGVTFGGDTLVFEGSLIEGLNSVVVDVTDLSFTTNPETYYYECLLSVGCAGNETSSYTRFYVSPHSLLNDPGFAEPTVHFNTITLLPDNVGIDYSATLIVAPDSAAQQIDSIAVLIDIGHSYNGDLSIDLISPQNDTITLMEFGNNYGGSEGLSILFQDGAIPHTEAPTPPQGVYAPSEPLSGLIGQPLFGEWTVSVRDNLASDSGYLFGVGLYLNSSPCTASISGTAFYDFDENGLQGPDEPSYPDALLYNSIDDQLFFTDSQGEYTDCVAAGNGSLVLTSPPLYYASGTDNSLDLNINEGDSQTGLDFPLYPTESVIDIQVDLYSLSPDRPGFDNVYFIQFENIGTECAQDVTVNVELDPQLTLMSYSNPNIVETGDGVELYIGEICPTENGAFELILNLSEDAQIGDTLISTVSTNVLPGEVSVQDNEESLISIVVASYDPNDKMVDHETIVPEFIENGQLEYMIRFQNTGNYYAERVVLTDEIPDELDLESLSIMASSHDYEVSIEDRTVFFTFDDIFLPDSASDPLNSAGYVRFEISPIEDLDIGDIVLNDAAIFFDFNPAIITNEAETELVMETVGLEEINDFEFTIGPNPSSDVLRLETGLDSESMTIVVRDLQGKIVLAVENEPTLENNYILPLDSLEQGLYTVTLRSHNKKASRIFAVVR